VNLQTAYFSQHQIDDLDLTATPVVLMRRLDPQLTEQEVRNYLGGYDFRGDKVFETVSIFSGGEKARLALALVAWQKPNLLLMDEPTNHLDIDMRHALTVALQGFEGAVVLISHDRHLLANTVDSFWLVDEGRVQLFEGDLDDYRQRVLGSPVSNPTRTASESGPAGVGQTGQSRDKKPASSPGRGTGKEIRQLRTRIKTLDERMERLHRKLAEVDTALGDTTLYESRENNQLQSLLRDQLSLREELEAAEEEWFEKSARLEELTED
ncbi:MAG: ATP-binding cassette domain-containing protein, partial [Pseudomonadales bacterium]|nr:ATP-binding cassette domain-containing protein [Pseudomonadales bacterium]